MPDPPPATRVHLGACAVATLVAVASCRESKTPRSDAVMSASSTAPATGSVALATSAAPAAPVTCNDYCGRMADCWDVAAMGAPPKPRNDIVSDCMRDCHPPTTDTMCCALIANCKEFAKCMFVSKSQPDDCGVLREALPLIPKE